MGCGGGGWRYFWTLKNIAINKSTISSLGQTNRGMFQLRISGRQTYSHFERSYTSSVLISEKDHLFEIENAQIFK